MEKNMRKDIKDRIPKDEGSNPSPATIKNGNH